MKLSNLLQSVTQNTASIDGNGWYPLRPTTAENTFFLQRVKAAWRVLAGTSDAIEWDYPTERKTPNVKVTGARCFSAQRPESEANGVDRRVMPRT